MRTNTHDRPHTKAGTPMTRPMGNPRINPMCEQTLAARAPALGLAILVSLALGCDGGSGYSPPPPAPAPGFTLSVSPASLTIPAGENGFVTVTAVRANGAGQPATIILAAEGLPAGLTASGSILAGDATGRLTIGAAPGMQPQTLSGFKVTGTTGSFSQSFTMTLTISAADVLISPDLVQASGGAQSGGNLTNSLVAGEGIPAARATSASGATEIRHGFSLVVH